MRAVLQSVAAITELYVVATCVGGRRIFYGAAILDFAPEISSIRFPLSFVRCAVCISSTYNGRPIESRMIMIYRTAPFSMTSNDPYPRFQGHAIL